MGSGHIQMTESEYMLLCITFLSYCAGDFNVIFEDVLNHLTTYRERSGSVVECLTRDRRATGSSLAGVTASWSLSKTHLS